ncbi:MAG: polysaccharide biosynthesis protein, partial [Burkholderiales bacterium]|nr:polysaccharide biosynthesis protein [Burkholderiales bacterium]
SDKNPSGDIAIDFIGLRPGEKLFEELLIGENPQRTSHPRIVVAKEDFISWDQLEVLLGSLEMAVNTNAVTAARGMLERLVPGYTPSTVIVDWVYAEEDT